MDSRYRPLGQVFETLERRDLLTSVPFGASSQDTGEFLLGDIAVNVVFVESDGSIDESTEDWDSAQIEATKSRIEEGVTWWSDALAKYTDVHELNFTFDYQYADDPFESSYEPISRKSQEFRLWIEEFFRDNDVPQASGFSTEIRNFNHQQRIKHDTNWSFTIFVVNAENDSDGLFASGSDFRRAFAYTGGRFIVMPHHRPASTVAHEVAHMFWAYDEYGGSDSYNEQRGYYRTQNTNATDDNPDPDSREPSLLETTTLSTSGPYVNHLVSQSARETMGWRDSDGDGIFDVLDVDHSISGTVTFDSSSRVAQFSGTSSVQTLTNRNTEGTGNDLTINKITDLQYRIDSGPWVDLATYNAYQVSIDVTTPAIPAGATSVEFRTIDDRIGVTSPSISRTIESGSSENVQLTNPVNPLDVTGDGFVSPVDALRVIRALDNQTAASGGPPFLDVSGDGFVSPRDVLMVISFLNDSVEQNTVVAANVLSANISVADVSAAAVSTDPPILRDSVAGPSEKTGAVPLTIATAASETSAAQEALFALFSNQRDLDDKDDPFWS